MTVTTKLYMQVRKALLGAAGTHDETLIDLWSRWPELYDAVMLTLTDDEQAELETHASLNT